MSKFSRLAVGITSLGRHHLNPLSLREGNFFWHSYG